MVWALYLCRLKNLPFLEQISDLLGHPAEVYGKRVA